MNRARRTLALLASIAVLAAAAIGVHVVLFGGYDVAATNPHLRPTVWLLETAMRSSVRVRSAHLQAPPLDDPGRIGTGAAVYREHCEACHGGPGVAPAPFALGLVPLPANLAGTARTWRPQSLFWVVKHGVKMTGMPAWEYRLDDEQIWSAVAFVRAMAHMTPAEYRALSPPPAPVPVAAARRPADAQRGKRALHQFACATCHRIPGVSTSDALVGPTLEGVAQRRIIAGALPNTPENLVRWLLAPQQVHPDSAMPNLGLHAQDAADIAAYLATLD